MLPAELRGDFTLTLVGEFPAIRFEILSRAVHDESRRGIVLRAEVVTGLVRSGQQQPDAVVDPVACHGVAVGVA
jgi:hypothetical protein